MEGNRRVELLPFIALALALVPIVLGAIALTPGWFPGRLGNAAGWLIIRGAFSFSCEILSPLALVLTLISIRKGGASRWAVPNWLALGLAVGETVPIWWLLIQLVFLVLFMGVRFIIRL